MGDLSVQLVVKPAMKPIYVFAVNYKIINIFSYNPEQLMVYYIY